MTKTYMVVRNGAKKGTGEIYSMSLRLHESKDKQFQWLDEKDTYWTDDIRPVGSMIKVEQMEVD